MSKFEICLGLRIGNNNNGAERNKNNCRQKAQKFAYDTKVNIKENLVLYTNATLTNTMGQIWLNYMKIFQYLL